MTLNCFNILPVYEINQSFYLIQVRYSKYSIICIPSRSGRRFAALHTSHDFPIQGLCIFPCRATRVARIPLMETNLQFSKQSSGSPIRRRESTTSLADAMQTTNNSRKRQNLRQTSCTECRRRKQRVRESLFAVLRHWWCCDRHRDLIANEWGAV